MSKRKDLSWLQCLADKFRGVCLSTSYKDNKAKYLWQCEYGHIFESSAGHVRDGHWCSECYGNSKKTLKYCQELATSQDGKCLSTTYINSTTLMLWQCKQNHSWEATLRDVGSATRKHWCPECAGKRHDLRWLQKLAAKNDGKCLSTNFINGNTKYLWECKLGHQFLSLAEGVASGRWCPFCIHRHSEAELEIYGFVKNIFPNALNGKTQLLISKGLELDIYISDLKLAIEYDGPYHSPNHKLFSKVQFERDLRKNQECEELGILLIRINYLDYTQNKDSVLNYLKELIEVRAATMALKRPKIDYEQFLKPKQVKLKVVI